MKTSLRFGVAILAAGRSSRMGQPKLLLPWGGRTVIRHLLSQWETLGAAQIGIVVSPEAAELNLELDRLNFPKVNRILNFQPDRGMFSSVQCAANWEGWDSGISHFLITLGDQPHLKESTLESLLRFSLKNPDFVAQPLRNGKRRHPIVVPRNVFMQLQSAGCENLKEFLREHPFRGFESDDAGLDLDMDTPQDYQDLLRRYNPTATERE